MAIPYASLFVAAGKKYGVDPAFLAAIARAESQFNRNAVNPSSGARGMMQLMPEVASHFGVDPMDPAQAVDVAARLLKDNLRKFGSVSLAAAAYNAGPGNVVRYGGVPPFAETQKYVRDVLAYKAEYQDAIGSAVGTSWGTVALGLFALGAVGSAIFYMQKGRLPFMKRGR